MAGRPPRVELTPYKGVVKRLLESGPLPSLLPTRPGPGRVLLAVVFRTGAVDFDRVAAILGEGPEALEPVSGRERVLYFTVVESALPSLFPGDGPWS